MGGLQFGVSSDGARVALQIDAGPMQVVERGQAKVVAAFPRPPYPPGVTDACPSFDIDGALQFVRTEFGQSRYNLGYLVSIDASVPGAPPVEVRGVTNVCTVMCPCPEATRDGMYMAWVAFQDTSLKTEFVHLARREASGAKRGWRVFRSWADSREFALDPTGRFIAIKDARGIHREAISNSSDRFDFGGSLRASPIAVSPDGKWLMTAYRGLSMFDERPLVIYRASDGRSFSTSLPEPYFDGGGTGPEGWIWTDAIH